LSRAEAAPPKTRAALIGRERELELIASFLDRGASQGEGLLVRGEPGVGKTALLGAAGELAFDAGTRVIRAAGVQYEADVAFSTLNQALLPLHAELGQLGGAPREALNVALGFGAGPPPDRLIVSNAALALLREAATDRPLLVIVDDVPVGRPAECRSVRLRRPPADRQQGRLPRRRALR
jgi:Cdc6-like AAA superfamily ATPase